MFVLGKKKLVSSNELNALFDQLDSERPRLYNTPLTQILDFLEELYNKIILSDFAISVDDLAILKDLFNPSMILERINLELGSNSSLDGFSPINKTHLDSRLVPKGIVCQVAANNVFLGVCDNLISTLVTKNILLLKVSSSDHYFIGFLIDAILACDEAGKMSRFINFIQFKGGDSSFESTIKKRSSKIIVWGGQDTIDSYSRSLGQGVELKCYGPRISISIITKAYVNSHGEQLAKQLAKDISRWEQRACSNVQNIFFEKGIDIHSFAQLLSKALPAKDLSDQNYFVELLKTKALIAYEQFDGHDSFCVESDTGFIFKTKDDSIRPTILNNTVRFNLYESVDNLSCLLWPQRQNLQSCSLGALGRERDVYLNHLALSGIKRFCLPGNITDSLLGAPHEGSYQLSELIDIVYDQFTPNESQFISHVKSINSFCAEIESTDEKQLKLEHFDLCQLTNKDEGGYFFTSGATTGTPKVAFYSYYEFDLIAYKMAQSYKVSGLVSDDTVLNLFFAGNMWSSFSVVQKSMEHIGCQQLPLGGNCSNEDFVSICRNFNPTTIFAVPGVLLRFAQYCKENSISIKVKSFYYAGEKLSEKAKSELKSIFGISCFVSAGYACVDTGIIGYQDQTCKQGDHILYKNISSLNIGADKTTLTSLLRRSHPVINYKLSDKVEWTDKEVGKFKLIGRSDQILFIWGARIDLALFKSILGDSDFQIIIDTSEMMELRCAISFEDCKHMAQKIYDNCDDLKATIGFSDFIKHFRATSSSFVINTKTGKMSAVIDHR